MKKTTNKLSAEQSKELLGVLKTGTVTRELTGLM
jgi:hypothetical protein